MVASAMTKKVKISQYVRPFLEYMPEIASPEYKPHFRVRVLYTLACLLAFLVASQIPLYGLQHGKSKNDPFFWLRAILASNRGTLMELGIAPIVTTQMVLQFLAGSKILEMEENTREERILYNATQKLAGLAFTCAQASAYVTSGMYGDPRKELGGANCVFIIAQLTVMGLVVCLLDETLQKGWGIGSGISLFITTNVCETIAWKTFSFNHIQTPNGVVYEGAVTSFIAQLFSRSWLSAITEAFYRPYGANLTNVVATLITFAVVVYFQGFRVDLTVKSQRVRGQTGNYPIRLFYTSNMPIILHSALISNIYFFSQLMWRRFRGNFFVSLLGQWQEVEYYNEQIPVGGLVYYLSPPSGLLDVLLSPLRFVAYCSLVFLSCAVLSKMWIDISGEAPRDVARKLREQQLTFVGYRAESLDTVLRKYIPQCALLGGVMIACLTIFADLVGCLGSGTGLLLAVNITYQYFEQIARESGVPGMML